MTMVLNPILLMTFFPLVGAAVILFFKSEQKSAIRWTALITSLVTFGLSLWVLAAYGRQDVSIHRLWFRIAGLPIHFHMAVDGLNILMVLLTTFLTPLAVLSTWKAV